MGNAELHDDDAAKTDAAASVSGNFAVGDEVFGVNWGQGRHDEENTPTGGTFAEYAKIPLKKLSKKPAAVSHEQAAAVALVGTTAYQSLLQNCKVESGSKVLILGGATAVGSIAIQLAKNVGAWVATTSSARTRSYVESFNAADLIIDYNAEKWEEVKDLQGGIDAVFDSVGETDGFARAKKILKAEGGAFCSIASYDAGFDPKGHPPLSYAAFFAFSNSSMIQDELAEMIASGKLKIVIEQTYDFREESIQRMLEESKKGKQCGKSVVKVSE